MSQQSPSVVDRTKSWLKFLKRGRFPTTRPDQHSGSFANAQDFTVNGGQFIDAGDINEMKVNYINNVISSRQAVFELLEPYTCLDATKDSSARHPPPRCHPDTRLKIRERLMRWLMKEYDEWKMLWVRGSAGTGKSAVAQSFADSCEEEEILGASYFFSRTAGRDKLETVVPTLVYQLAREVPEYHTLIEHRLAKDHVLLRNSPPVQFRKLIVEPFATLQHQHPRKPIVVILDGLDECKGGNAQREIFEMITNAIRTNPDLPLRWLIFSRPEAHLKNVFPRSLECGREELIIDTECRENVERYVKDRLIEIKATYDDMIPADWPPQNKLEELLDAVSGLFIFASTCLNYIDDPEEGDPVSQLDSLLSFLRRSQGVVSRNPLATLDLLYSRILQDIPPNVFGTTGRILAYMCYRSIFDDDNKLDSAQALSNFLRLDQHDFYKAARGLYSAMSVPEPGDAAQTQLRFYHASFQDFLLDPHRSGRFVIGEYKAQVIFLQSWIYWLNVDATHFHTLDGWNFDHDHTHDSLPGLTWASEDNRLRLSESITELLENGLSHGTLDMQWDGVDGGLLSQLSNVDFRYWMPAYPFAIAILCRLDSSTSIVRVEPSSPTDYQLLKYFNLVIGNGVAKPARFPLKSYRPDDEWNRQFFFIGHGSNSVIAWRTGSPGSWYGHFLRSDQEPTEAHISMYRDVLHNLKWNEEEAALAMG
ncbi:hypothetical protein AGABI1DRAFT_125839 [Agaricus bisporus var. burnettii JB137-S8]|uniref:Nephrocystin 3-like N-terminal domain-containing protein n=1 Tax=Agaricus bisporus var. burnettii (strain JB137-S8 / ATCC MYA-4627 / FGSC 10392) TaxID=597362 RepID=K5XDN9_AGABU|nr:uncharacterized protein AGABI1DRAFT_125839 [Agaricus bisporus var. burnettii JB137-S8]EKM81453.1 hypothetical protein AGABI1DRAFT_125839 [Agaricus bisporus var. burnettii JB137-S8]